MTHTDILLVRDLMPVFPPNPSPLRAQGTLKKRRLKENKSHSKAHMSSGRLRQHALGLRGSAPGPLCMYGFQFSIFKDPVWISESYAFSWALSLLFVLSNSNILVFVLLYFILL